MWRVGVNLIFFCQSSKVFFPVSTRLWEALRILGVWPTNIQMGVVPIKAVPRLWCLMTHMGPRVASWLCDVFERYIMNTVFPEKVVHPAFVKCILYRWQMLELLLDSMISCLELHFIHLLNVMICWRVWSHSVPCVLTYFKRALFLNC